jgi:lipopolysaccharide transport system ATP-binding protein
MQDIADKQGRTILFVSHNMAAIESLTSRALLLNLGQLTHEGKVSDAVDNYLNQIAYSTRPSLSMWRQHSGTGEATIQDVIFMDAEGQAVDSFRPGSQIRIAFIVRVNTRLIFDVAFVIETAGSFPLFASHMSDSLHVEHRDGLFHFNVSISPNFLRHGCYYISFGLYSMDFKTRYDEYLHYPAFTIDGYSESVISDKRWGPLFFPFRWEVVCPKDHSTKNFPKNKGIACLK